MVVIASDDISLWVTSRAPALVRAWTIEIENALSWDRPFAEALATEFHAAMLVTLDRNGAESNFLRLIQQSNTGLPAKLERGLAVRFYSVTLTLARSAGRRSREGGSRRLFPYLRADVNTDGRELPGTEPLNGIILRWDHPFWCEWLPPLHPDDIRATYNTVSQRDLDRSGESVTTEDDLDWRRKRLTVRWPSWFEPLLDFRQIGPATVDPVTDLRPTPQQLRDILVRFGQ